MSGFFIFYEFLADLSLLAPRIAIVILYGFIHSLCIAFAMEVNMKHLLPELERYAWRLGAALGAFT